MPGGEQTVGQGAVVGEQQQALGVLVQPPRGKEPHPAQMLRQQLQHRGLPGILRGGHQAGGLVEHQVHLLLPADALPVHREDGGGIRLVLRCAGSHPVHRHPARPDQLPGLLP